MNNIYIVAIDPGINGGIVASRNGHIVDIAPMPAGPRALYKHFLYLGFPGVCYKDNVYIFMEKVHSMPTDARKAAFTFGKGLGWLEAIIAVVSPAGPIEVNPAIWQSNCGMGGLLLKSKDFESKYEWKKNLWRHAKAHAPKEWRDKITMKTCDAFLIGQYGYKFIRNRIDGKIDTTLVRAED